MSNPPPNDPIQAIVIGASAGAVDALLHLLPPLPRDYPLPLMIVVHLHPESDSTLASLLASRCHIIVKEAEDKELIRPGTAYLAPPNYHLMVEPNFELSLSSDEPVLFSRPSIDVLFESAADAYGSSVAGFVLTGANSDGAHGLKAICAAGGPCFVQAPIEAEATAMPEASLAACPTAKAFTLAELTHVLLELGAPRS